MMAKQTAFVPLSCVPLGAEANAQAPTPFLDGKHTIFGRVYSGMKTVQRLEAVRTDGNDRPLEEIKIHKARIGKDLAPGDRLSLTQ